MRPIKNAGKALLCFVLERQVKKLRSKNNFLLIAVAGSVGKTSTKLAIAQALSVNYLVRFQTGNYNDRLTVPLIFFGHEQPGLFNVYKWLKIFYKNSRTIKKGYKFDVVVVELGTDGPGQMSKFAYLKPELGVLSGITPEHMEYFENLDAVAKEEMVIAEFSKQMLINADETNKKYYSRLNHYKTYGLKSGDYHFDSIKKQSLDGQVGQLSIGGESHQIKTTLIGDHGLKIVLAAVAVGNMIGQPPRDSVIGAKSVVAYSGRMQVLSGIQNSKIIDDSYNASPSAMYAGLDALYELKAPQKIALLGNMNELGQHSQPAHQQVGEYCDPDQLDLVVTLGADANKYLADSAEQKGCNVVRTKSPYEAGEVIKKALRKKAVVFVKGSQNGVFAEEAIKTLLANPDDYQKLVRQSKKWLKTKSKQFK